MNYIPPPPATRPNGEPEEILARIVATATKNTGATVSDVMSRSKFYRVSLARMIATHIARTDFRFNYSTLSMFFGRCHSTVQYSSREIGLRAACDRNVALCLSITRKELGL